MSQEMIIRHLITMLICGDSDGQDAFDDADAALGDAKRHEPANVQKVIDQLEQLAAYHALRTEES